MVLIFIKRGAYRTDTDFALLDVRVPFAYYTPPWGIKASTICTIIGPYKLVGVSMVREVIASLWVKDSGSSSTSEPGSANTEDTATRRTVTTVSTIAGAISFSIFITYTLYPFATIIRSRSWGYY